MGEDFGVSAYSLPETLWVVKGCRVVWSSGVLVELRLSSWHVT